MIEALPAEARDRAIAEDMNFRADDSAGVNGAPDVLWDTFGEIEVAPTFEDGDLLALYEDSLSEPRVLRVVNDLLAERAS